jgi:hypothetical protein
MNASWRGTHPSMLAAAVSGSEFGAVFVFGIEFCRLYDGLFRHPNKNFFSVLN